VTIEAEPDATKPKKTPSPESDEAEPEAKADRR